MKFECTSNGVYLMDLSELWKVLFNLVSEREMKGRLDDFDFCPS
jgi:hypothetical protein